MSLCSHFVKSESDSHQRTLVGSHLAPAYNYRYLPLYPKNCQVKFFWFTLNLKLSGQINTWETEVSFPLGFELSGNSVYISTFGLSRRYLYCNLMFTFTFRTFCSVRAPGCGLTRGSDLKNWLQAALGFEHGSQAGGQSDLSEIGTPRWMSRETRILNPGLLSWRTRHKKTRMRRKILIWSPNR